MGGYWALKTWWLQFLKLWDSTTKETASDPEMLLIPESKTKLADMPGFQISSYKPGNLQILRATSLTRASRIPARELGL